MNKNIYDYLESILSNIQEIDLIRPGMTFFQGPPITNNPKLDATFSYFAQLNDIDSWLKNINYLIYSINYSANLAVITLKEKNEYWPFSSQNNLVFFHNENIMFRVISLWDLLAQLTNTIFQTQEPIDRISYKKYFKKYANTQYSKQPFYEFIKNIYDYLNEQNEDNNHQDDFDRTDLTVRWQGNHEIINQIRNSFTHKLNPHIMNVHNARHSSYGLNLPKPPEKELKRLIEDYEVVYECILILRKSIKSPFSK